MPYASRTSPFTPTRTAPSEQRRIEPGEDAHGEHARLEASIEGRRAAAGDRTWGAISASTPSSTSGAQLGESNAASAQASRFIDARAAEHPRGEGDAHLRDGERGREDGVDEVLARVRADLDEGPLRPRENHWLRQGPQHERERAGGVGHRVRAVHHDDAVERPPRARDGPPGRARPSRTAACRPSQG